MKYEIEMNAPDGWEPDEWVFTNSDSTTQCFLDEFGDVHKSMDFMPAWRLVLRRTTAIMPPEMHRKLWGVIPGGYWVAWNSIGRLAWFSERPAIGLREWVCDGDSCYLPPYIEKPDGLPWDNSAMQMPECGPEQGREFELEVHPDTPNVVYSTGIPSKLRGETIKVREVL